MKTVYVVSLSKHRIDEMLADLIEIALKKSGATVRRELPNDNIRRDKALLIVTNGVMDYTNDWCINVVKAMDKYNTLYLCDDITTYVPKEHVTIVSQFKDFSKVHPNAKNNVVYWQISKLGDLMRELPWWPDVETIKPIYDFVYWGHCKKEREEQYKRFIPDEPSTLIIGDYKEWMHILPNCTYKPYERNMAELYKLIASGKRTYVFGDAIHNAAGNTPLRIYEGEQCTLSVKVDDALNVDRAYLNYTNATLIASELEDIANTAYPAIDIYSLPGDVIVEKPNTQLEHITTDTTSILEQRATIYGSYIGGVECRAKIIDALNEKHIECNGTDLPSNLVVMFGDLALKMMRIASDPTHKDSYIDLEGYARIIKEANVFCE